MWQLQRHNDAARTLQPWLWRLVCGVCVFWSLSVSAFSPDPSMAPTVIRIAAEDNWPPFSNEKGQGLSQQLVSAAFASQGFAIETIAMPYARALHETAQGDVDACWNVTRQQSTLETYLLHQTPLFRVQASFYYHQQRLNYRSVQDIPDGTVVGVILGYEYGDLYEQHKQRFKLVQVSTHQQLIQLLASNKLDLAIFFDDVLDYYLQQPELRRVKLLRGQPNHVSDIFVAFDKKNPRSTEYAKALDAGLQHLHHTGAYRQLMQGAKTTTRSQPDGH